MRHTPTATLAVCLVALLPCALAWAAPLTRETVERSNDEIVASLKEHSAAKVRAWFSKRATPDYAQVENGKRTSRQECLQGALQMLQGKYKKIDWKIQSFKSGPKEAHSVEQWVYQMTQRGEDGEDHVLVMTDTEDNLWVPTSTGWKVKSVKVLTNKVTLDGEPIDAPERRDTSVT